MYIIPCIYIYIYIYLLDISRQLACMKLGSREKISPYTVLLGSYEQVARLPSFIHAIFL